VLLSAARVTRANDKEAALVDLVRDPPPLRQLAKLSGVGAAECTPRMMTSLSASERCCSVTGLQAADALLLSDWCRVVREDYWK
jgi:hypothetical protein